MPDIPNREQLEAELARRIARLTAAQRRELFVLMGDPPNYGNIPSSFWSGMGADLSGAFVPFLSGVFMAAVERMLDEFPFEVDWGLINTRAVAWARLHAGELIRGITSTTQSGVQESIAAFFEGGLTRADLEDMLGRFFSAARAERIAVTEVTRAASEGEQELVRELERMGIKMVPIWQTRNDELVCPICGPRHGEEITDGMYPPAHPNCRCWWNQELPKP